jgi:hypothetical protein
MRYNVLDLRLEPRRELGRGPERRVITARADGDPRISPEDAAFDAEALRAHLEGDGDLWLITCRCGISECGGVDEPVKVARQDGVVRWMHPYDWLPAVLAFEQAAYVATVRAAAEELAQAVAAWNERRPGAVRLVPDVAGLRR